MPVSTVVDRLRNQGVVLGSGGVLGVLGAPEEMSGLSFEGSLGEDAPGAGTAAGDDGCVPGVVVVLLEVSGCCPAG